MITEPPMPGRLPRRWVPSLLGIALFAVAAALYQGGFTHAFAMLMDALGGYHKDLRSWTFSPTWPAWNAIGAGSTST